MHFHFPFSAPAILWTLTFAAHLVLLVVLIGRERMARFPWFTASIALIALRLLVLKLLGGRLPQFAFAVTIVVMLVVTAFVSLMVVVEMARRAFTTARRASWLAGAFGLIALGAVVLWFWGKWPPWKALIASPPLQLLEFIAQKAGLLADVETVGIGIPIVALGYRCGAGWRSHVQRIVIGLSTASLAQIAVEAVWQAITHTAVVHGITEYNRVLQLRDRLFNANSAIYILVLIWWIAVLWKDEPGTRAIASDENELALESGADAETETSAGEISGSENVQDTSS